ncbi:amidohydrolase [bacterium]|nr:amidohydrolase [bacterium]
MTEYDLTIHCGQLLSMKDDQCEIETKKIIAINGEKIEAVLDAAEASKINSKKTIDASNRLVMPGLINGHCHLSMNLFRGLADDLPFKEWLFDNILPLEARLVSPEFVRIGARLAMLENLYFGNTTASDMYYFEDCVADAATEFGLRCVLGESVADFGPPDQRDNPGNNFKILEKMMEMQKSNPRLIPSVAPHAPYSCSDDTLKEAIAFATQHKLPISIHVSETKSENQECMEKFKKSPTQRCFDLGLMERPSIFAHGIHLSDEDIKLIASTNTGVIYNPESNMKLGSGICRVPALLKAGVNLGIGTDSVASNNDLNIFKEMDTGAKLQKLANSDNTALTAKDCLRMATSMGARAQHLENLGQIRKGFLADIICLDLRKPWLEPQHDVLAQLVYSANGSEVEDVICHGEILMANRKPLKVSNEQIFEEAQRYRENNEF